MAPAPAPRRAPRAAALLCAALLLACAPAPIAASCDRSSLESVNAGWTPYLVYEADWVDYIIWAGCAVASFGPGTQVVTGLCATTILGKIGAAIETALIKAAVAPPTRTELIKGLSQGVAVASADGIWNVKVGALGFPCKVCNCRPWCSLRCSAGSSCESCMQEPSRLGIFVAVKKNPVTPPPNGQKCMTVINKGCSKTLYYSTGVPSAQVYAGKTYDRWWSSGWYSVAPGASRRLCWPGVSQFYLHVDDSGVGFSGPQKSQWCIHRTNAFDVFETDKKNGPLWNFYDSKSGAKAATCEGMGTGYAWRTFYRFTWGTYTGYDITVASCSGRTIAKSGIAGAAALALPPKGRIAGATAVRTRGAVTAADLAANPPTEVLGDDGLEPAEQAVAASAAAAEAAAAAAAPAANATVADAAPAAAAAAAPAGLVTAADVEAAAAAERAAPLIGAGQPLVAGGFADLTPSPREPLGRTSAKRSRPAP